MTVVDSTELDQIAADAIYLIADDADDDEIARLQAMSAVEVVEYFYTAFDCDVFAVALNELTGWPIRGINSRSLGPVHRLVEAPDGRLLDAKGWQSLDDLKQRYARGDISLWRGEVAGASADETDEAKAKQAMRHLQRAPFTESWLMERLVPEADIPPQP